MLTRVKEMLCICNVNNLSTVHLAVSHGFDIYCNIIFT